MTVIGIFVIVWVVLVFISICKALENVDRRRVIDETLGSMEECVIKMESIRNKIAGSADTALQMRNLNEIAAEFNDLNDQCILLLEDENGYVNKWAGGANTFAAGKYHRDSKRRTELVVRYNQIYRSVSSMTRT